MNAIIYIGPYLQILDKKVQSFDLSEYIIETTKERLMEVPPEDFDINYTLLISNQKNVGRYIDCEYGGQVIEIEKIKPEEEKKKFQNKYSDIIKILEQNYDKVLLKHGIIYYRNLMSFIY